MKEKYSSWNDLVFENRNKTYGAYELRQRYASRLTKAFGMTLISVSVLFLFVYIRREPVPPQVPSGLKDPVVFSKTFTADDIPVKTRANPGNKGGPEKPTDRNNFIPVKDTLLLSDKTDTSHVPAGDTSAVALNGTSSANAGDTLFPEGAATEQGAMSLATVDKKPEFPGGMEKFYKYLVHKIRYTREAREARLTGKIYVSFVIDGEGMVREIEILNKIGYGLEEEVHRVLSASPQWSPGLVSNRPVKTKMVLPVSFSLVQ